MKRRQFIKSIAGLFAATQVPSVLAKPKDELTYLFVPPEDDTFSQLMGNKPMTATELLKRQQEAEALLNRQMADNLALTSYPDKGSVDHKWTTDDLTVSRKPPIYGLEIGDTFVDGSTGYEYIYTSNGSVRLS